jgi:hypothetical protein
MATAKAKKAPAVEKLPRFAKWIEEYGVAKLADAMGVGRFAVYGWRRGSVNIANGRALSAKGGTRPDPAKLSELIKLAAGQLTAADIYPKEG